jgi:hypothetical protein
MRLLLADTSVLFAGCVCSAPTPTSAAAASAFVPKSPGVASFRWSAPVHTRQPAAATDKGALG